MSTFLSTSIAPRIDLQLLRRDFFDGLSILLQTSSGTPYDLSATEVCCSVWKRASSGELTQITTINTEKKEPLRSGMLRLWLTSAQTAAIWDAYSEVSVESSVFFPNAYTEQAQNVFSSPLAWDLRVETREYLANLTSVVSGVFISQINHGLASSERVVFSGTTSSPSINYNNTSATIYSGLTNISYQAPYTFTIPSLTGVTSSGIGGSVYRLRQDTVVAGNVIVGSTVSNCFP
jgi:hypothetical protein